MAELWAGCIHPLGAACAFLRAGIRPLRDNIPDMELTLLKALRDQTLPPFTNFFIPRTWWGSLARVGKTAQMALQGAVVRGWGQESPALPLPSSLGHGLDLLPEVLWDLMDRAPHAGKRCLFWSYSGSEHCAELRDPWRPAAPHQEGAGVLPAGTWWREGQHPPWDWHKVIPCSQTRLLW